MIGLTINKSWFIVTSIALLVMAILAGFAFGYVFIEVYDSENVNLTQDKLNANMLLFRFGIAAWLVIILLDLLVSLGLYQIYNSSSKRLAVFSSSLRVIYTFVLCIAVYFLAQPILIDIDAPDAAASFESFLSIWNVGLIIFGVHLVLLSVNCMNSDFTPKVIVIFLLVGGISYIVVHGLKVFLSNDDLFAVTAESLLIIPMALSELSLALWLIFKYLKIRAASTQKYIAINQ